MRDDDHDIQYLSYPEYWFPSDSKFPFRLGIPLRLGIPPQPRDSSTKLVEESRRESSLPSKFWKHTPRIPINNLTVMLAMCHSPHNPQTTGREGGRRGWAGLYLLTKCWYYTLLPFTDSLTQLRVLDVLLGTCHETLLEIYINNWLTCRLLINRRSSQNYLRNYITTSTGFYIIIAISRHH